MPQRASETSLQYIARSRLQSVFPSVLIKAPNLVRIPPVPIAANPSGRFVMAINPERGRGFSSMLIWYVLHTRHGFVPVTVKRLRQLNVEFIVPTNRRDVIFAKLIPEQCASV